MTDLSTIRDDLVAQQESLDEIVATISDEQWRLATPSPGWNVTDQIGHLTFFDGTAAVAIIDTVAFRASVSELMAGALDVGIDDYTLGDARSMSPVEVLDAWREAAGLTYESEKPAAFLRTISRRPLAKRADAPMKYAPVAGLPFPVARLIMGMDNQRTMPHAAAMCDDYIERGGNTFDTAWVYGSGLQEKLLGLGVFLVPGIRGGQ